MAFPFRCVLLFTYVARHSNYLMAASRRKKETVGDTNHLCTIKPVIVQSLGKGKGTRGYQKVEWNPLQDFIVQSLGKGKGTRGYQKVEWNPLQDFL